MTGSSGEAISLLLMSQLLGDGRLLERAVRLADTIVETLAHAVSARAGGARSDSPRTGFTCGDAGIAYSLLEFFHETGIATYRQAAQALLDRIRQFYDSQHGNWPDGWGDEEQDVRYASPRSYSISWCQGAPGIAITSLRAYELLGESRYQQDACAALVTTQRMLQRSIRSETGNYSLCHGIAGDSVVVMYGCAALPSMSDARRLATEAANEGIRLYGRRGLEWPCGTEGGESPGLMAGLAGIGYFYLHCVDVTSVPPLAPHMAISGR
jgi:lantibiotic modifying enzyme